MNTFAEKVKYLRKEAGITQKELAQKLQLTNSTICDWEKERSEPNLEQLRALSLLFEVSTDYLVGLEDEAGAKIRPKYNISVGNLNNSGKIDLR